ncbi:MAG: GGDEF domain-containing protein [Bdellovibrionales bacterium]|nr:GGDEF domain-containing protein [Bdellovibrionales bacterium]
MIHMIRIVIAFVAATFGSIYVEYQGFALFFLCGIWVWNLFQKDLKISQGNKQRRRKIEVFILLQLIVLLCVDVFSSYYFYLLFFPITGAILLLRMSWFWAFVNFVLCGIHLRWLYPEYWVVGTLVFGMWLVFSVSVTYMNRKKIEMLGKKLAVFERESRKYLQDTEKELVGVEQQRMAQATQRIGQEKEQFYNLTQVLFEIFVPHTCSFYVFDAVEETFLLKSFQSADPSFEEHHMMPNEGIFRLISSQKKTMQIHENAIPELIYYKNAPDIKSILVCPLVKDDRLYGVMMMDHLEVKHYTGQEISIVERICSQFYHVISDSKTLAQFEHLKQEFSSFYQASSALNHAFRLQEVLETLLHMAKSIALYDWGCVVLYNQDVDKNMIVLDSNQDQHQLVGKTFRLEYQKGSVSWSIDQMKPLHYNNFIQKHRHSSLFHQKIKVPNIYESVLILPLYAKDEKIGAILLMSEKNFFFTRIIQNMLEVLAFQASIAIKNAISVGYLEKLATTDGLTNLVNHRTFQEELSKELLRCKRYGHDLSMMLIDLDHFKKINDEYGHPAGDFILKNTAMFLQEQVRTTDLVARYGGEEFAIILPNTSSDAAKKLAKRMIEKIGQSQWKYNQILIPVTFSIGIASFPEHAQEQPVLIEHADQALYHAKNNGRNQVFVFEKSMAISDLINKENEMVQKLEQQM